MTFKFPTPVPEVPVRDIAAAAAYYLNNFGFSLDWGGQEIGLAGISRGRCRMFLADQEARQAYGNVGPTLIWLNLESNEEVDELYREWSASNARLLSAPEAKPWGWHVQVGPLPNHKRHRDACPPLRPDFWMRLSLGAC